ncbi:MULTISPECIES: LLM class F420-dependent oxidoreductase [Streptomyces]|uniref:LLM class F420-dependent oxidoreductase n=1 Tax=Streptomyces TaxID=1883 RepID=UPI00167068DC|nr:MULTISPECIES: LLM class F420-dependent oxidoreductase [Streptomyces]UFR01382.1 LLM class F420-dependent oxidoreductase [Streptomyces sp. Go40/10]GGS91830.1 LLM class F420-dependent oxidoreductase [Streptomyces cinerochromogenes]
MKLGLMVSAFDWPGGSREYGRTLGRIGRDAEQAGFSSLWVMDHFFQTPLNGPPEGDCLEAYTTLAYIAGQTTTLRLGTMVSGVTHRHPAVLVKTVTTLDVLSGGRAALGIGASWYEEEQRAYGIPVRPLRERFERLEEALRIAHRMWAGDESPFKGEHYQLERPLNAPAPLSRPHPPILVGGQGEKRTFRLIAQYADACNFYEPPTPEMLAEKMRTLPPDHPMRRGGGRDPFGMLRRKLAVLRERCEEYGRPWTELEKTTLGGVTLSRTGGSGTMTPAQAVDRYGALAGLGIDHAVVEPSDLHRPGALELWGEVVAQVR